MNPTADFPANGIHKKKSGEEVPVFEFQELRNVYLTDVTVKDSTFGKQWQLNFADHESGEMYHLQTDYGSNFGVGLLNTLANCQDLGGLSVIVYATKNKNDETKIFTNSQVYDVDGNKVGWLYSIADMPKKERIVSKSGKVMIQGEDEFLEFVENNIIAKIKERL